MECDSIERRLGLHYDLDLDIPTALTNAIKRTARHDGVGASLNLQQGLQYEGSTLENSQHTFSDVEASGIRLLSDNSVSYARRERIAMSILTGKYCREIGEVRSLPTQESTFEIESRILSGVVQGPVRGELKGPNFLELSCSSVTADMRSPRTAACDNRQRIRELSREPKEVYSWAGTTLFSADAQDRPKISIRSTASDDVIKKDSSVNTNMRQWKMDNIQKNKAELSIMAFEADKLRREVEQSNGTKVRLIKDLKQFRQKLRDRLNEKNDSHVGSVMRYVDKDTAHRFLELEEGHTVSVDDAIALIGCGLGSEGSVELSKSVLFQNTSKGVPHTEYIGSSSEIDTKGYKIDNPTHPIEYPQTLVTYDKHGKELGWKVPVLSAEIGRRDRAHRKGLKHLAAKSGTPLSPVKKSTTNNNKSSNNKNNNNNNNESSENRIEGIGGIEGEYKGTYSREYILPLPDNGRKLSSAQLNDLGNGTTQFDRVESELRRKNTLKDLRLYQHDAYPPVYRKLTPKIDRRVLHLNKRLNSVSAKKPTSFIMTGNGSESFAYANDKNRDPFLIPRFSKIKERNEIDDDSDADTLSTLSPRGEVAPLASTLSVKSKPIRESIRVCSDYQKKRHSINYPPSNLRQNRPSLSLAPPPYTSNFEVLRMSQTDVPPNAGLGLWGNPQERGNGRCVQSPLVNSLSEIHAPKLRVESAPKPFFGN